MSLVIPPLGDDADYGATANWIASAAEAINNAAGDFLEELVELANIDFSDVGDLPSFYGAVFQGQMSGIGSRPVKPALIVQNMNGLLSQLAAIPAPVPPTVTFTYTDPGYASIVREPLIQKMLYDLQNGGYGIEPLDEQSLWDRARDREAVTMLAAVEEVRKQSVFGGFPVPQGSADAALAKASQDMAFKVSSINRDIALERAKMYVDNRRFVIEKLLAHEQMNIALYNAAQARIIEAGKVRVEMAIALFDAGVKMFKYMQDAIISQIEAPIKINEQLTRVYATEVQAYAAFVNALTATAQVDIENSKLFLERDKAQYQGQVEGMRFKLQQLVATIEKNRDIHKFGVDYYKTALGSAMNGINGLAVQSREVT